MHSSCKIRFIQWTFFTVWRKKHVVLLCNTYYMVTKETARKVGLFASYLLSTKRVEIIAGKIFCSTNYKVRQACNNIKKKLYPMRCLRLEYNDNYCIPVIFFFTTCNLPPPPPPPLRDQIHMIFLGSHNRLTQ